LLQLQIQQLKEEITEKEKMLSQVKLEVSQKEKENAKKRQRNQGPLFKTHSE